MTEERTAWFELLQKADDGDFLGAAAEVVLQLLMEADVDGVIGAGRREHSPERLNDRNRHRPGSLDSHARPADRGLARGPHDEAARDRRPFGRHAGDPRPPRPQDTDLPRPAPLPGALADRGDERPAMDFRRVAARNDKPARSFLDAITLAAIYSFRL